MCCPHPQGLCPMTLSHFQVGPDSPQYHTEEQSFRDRWTRSFKKRMLFFQILPIVCFITALFSLTPQINMCDIALEYPLGISHIQPEVHRALSILLNVKRVRGMADRNFPYGKHSIHAFELSMSSYFCGLALLIKSTKLAFIIHFSGFLTAETITPNVIPLTSDLFSRRAFPHEIYILMKKGLVFALTLRDGGKSVMTGRDNRKRRGLLRFPGKILEWQTYHNVPALGVYTSGFFSSTLDFTHIVPNSLLR
ncbi:hypothetical protein STEG23_037379 [Scotinomys teguina]